MQVNPFRHILDIVNPRKPYFLPVCFDLPHANTNTHLRPRNSRSYAWSILSVPPIGFISPTYSNSTDCLLSSIWAAQIMSPSIKAIILFVQTSSFAHLVPCIFSRICVDSLSGSIASTIALKF